ncbi:glutamate--tRNA ligase, partial [Patescibacteria group bacterium]|nr:glutamate--tRNA ligase [Patescibacteria group bacterium]
ELIKNGHAYYCFCASAELEKEREAQKKKKLPTKYSGKCSKLKKSEVNKKLKAGEPFVVRLKVPEKGRTGFSDIVYGKVEVENALIDHQVLLKSDGYPTYHLANVVDDHLMKITHVIRGEEWLPSTPKHILLYKALGWELPEFAHLPLLLNPDKSKLSKRQGDVAVEDYLTKGYLPEALINFVALLGWNPTADREIYTLDELIKYFDLKSVNKGGAILNKEKLYWVNGEYIKKKPVKELAKLCTPYLIETKLIEEANKKFKIIETGEEINKDWLEKIVALEQERMKRLDEIPQLTEFFFKESLDYGAEELIWKKSNRKETKENLERLLTFLRTLSEKDFIQEKLEKKIKKWIEDNNLKTGEVLWPMRVALSGLRASPSPFEIAEILGKKKATERIQTAIKKLS